MNAVGPEMSHQQFLVGILPHFVFEITGTFFAGTYGLWAGKQFYKKTIKKESISIKQVIQQAFTKYLKIVLPLMLVAAAVETFITPIIIGAT